MMGFFRFLLILFSPVFLIMFLIIARFVLELIRGRRMKKRSSKIPKKKSFFRKLFIDFPKAFVNDLFERDPDGFRDYGLHLICGEQGSGKTITLAYILNEYKADYPLAHIRTNFYYEKQDGEITHWKDLIFTDNGIYGQIEVLDEIQNWFSSNQSKDFPIEMIQEISQQRKQRKVIYGTAQVFTRVAKPIREQVTFLYQPFTIFGCLTIVRVSRPVMDDNATVLRQKFLRMFFFVHSKDVRDAFDTYRKIEKLSDGGFSPRDFNNVAAVVVGDNKRKK